MIKKIIKVSGVILLLGFISTFQRGFFFQKNKNDKFTITMIEKQKLIEEQIISDLLKASDPNNSLSEETDEKINIVPQEEMTEEISIDPQEEIDQNIMEDVKYFEEKNTMIKSNTNQNENENVNNTPKIDVQEQSAWEKLGISEYDYHHSPARKDQTITFNIESCLNEIQCRQDCINYGEQYIETHNGSYACNTINSYSGKYLGEEFEFFELQS